MKKRKNKTSTIDDYLKTSKRGNRQAEQEMLGPGFHSFHKIHKSKKTYTRKEKHKRDFI